MRSVTKNLLLLSLANACGVLQSSGARAAPTAPAAPAVPTAPIVAPRRVAKAKPRLATVTLFAEAEASAPPAPVPEPRSAAAAKQPLSTRWMAKSLGGASGGAVLFHGPIYRPPESSGVAFNVPRAGRYRVWVRYFKKTPAAANLYVVVRDESTEVRAFQFLDYQSLRVPTETPYAPPAAPFAGKSGFVWEPFFVTLERPTSVTLHFGGGSGERQIDCVLWTSNLALDPGSADQSTLSRLATAAASASLPVVAAPKGFSLSKGVPVTTDAFAGMADPERRFWAGLINNGSVYGDAARMIRMGFNRDHSSTVAARWGIRNMTPVEGFYDPAFAKAHPSPEGRFINAKGEVSTAFSLHYQPWVEAAQAGLRARILETLKTDEGSLGFWRISAEEGGWLDYSPYAQAAFRQWLQQKHGSIETLNRRWGTKYSGFDEIVPARSYDEGRASWLEFREFSGHSYAVSVGRRIPVVHELDPKHRPALGANSNLDIAAPYFMAFRPNDFEELIRVGLKAEKYVAFDIYCADDDMASSIEMLTSFAQGRKLINQEFSNHVVDARIAARTYWVQVAKGVHGIHLFMVQDNTGHATYPKWGLQALNGRPKEKLAAYSDAVQEVHRLEPLLMAAQYTHAVKPVALYWSRIDLGLDQPHDSFYGHALNSPIHVYETLRSQGYPVRWITPRQISEGELAKVGALVMVGSNHVPQVAAQRIEAWVKDGGTVIADSWPGAFDEYGQPQSTLTPIFGVRPAPAKATGKPPSELALQESTQGYGEVTDAAVLRQNYFQKVDEIAQQPGATHPVARALGDFMVAGVAPDNVECFAGKVVGMSHRGRPGFVINDYGRGKALYSGMLLGTIYEAAPTRYEWDTTHAGLSYHRLLNTFLEYSGVEHGSRVAGLPARIRAKLRIESPLVSANGNILIGLTSMNDDIVRPFDLEVVVPANSGPFTEVLVATQGSRALTKVAHKVSGGKLRLRMPSFDTHAMILALKDAGPLVSLQLKGVERGPAALAIISPGQIFEVVATVHNPGRHVMPPGTLRFTAPTGWFQTAKDARVNAIQPGGEARCHFRIRAPQVAGGVSLQPLLARFRSGTVESTPATEMVWWGAGS